jgi:hypothetical protein
MDSHNEVAALRERIIAALLSLEQDPALVPTEWWLLGTAGCHLCIVAEDIMSRLQAVQPIRYQHIDIADFDELLMMEFANSIPVLLTSNKRLDYPFSVLDLQLLVD